MEKGIKLRRIIFNIIFLFLAIKALIMVFYFASDFSAKSKVVWCAPLMGALALLFSALKIHEIMLCENKNQNFINFVKDILKSGIGFFLKQSILCILAGVVSFFIIWHFISLQTAICFEIGIAALLCAVLSSVLLFPKAEGKIAEAPFENVHQISLNAGMSTGFILLALNLILIPIIYFTFRDIDTTASYALGASLASFLLNLSGGIHYSSICVKEEKERKDIILANNIISENKAAENFSVFACMIASIMYIGSIVLDIMGIMLPFTILASSIFAMISGCIFALIKSKKFPILPVYLGNFIVFILNAAFIYYIINVIFLPDFKGLIYASFSGIISAFLITAVMPFLIGKQTNELSCFKNSMFKVFITVGLAALFAMAAFILIGGMASYNAGMYGVLLAVLGFSSAFVFVSAYSYFKSLSLNASEIIKLDDETFVEDKKLILAANLYESTSSVILSAIAVLVALMATVSFGLSVEVSDLDILNPFILFSVLFGASIPYILCALYSLGIQIRGKFKIHTFFGSFLGSIMPFLCIAITPIILIIVIRKLFEITLVEQTLGGFMTGFSAAGICLAIKMLFEKDFKKSYSGVIISSILLTIFSILLFSVIFID